MRGKKAFVMRVTEDEVSDWGGEDVKVRSGLEHSARLISSIVLISVSGMKISDSLSTLKFVLTNRLACSDLCIGSGVHYFPVVVHDLTSMTSMLLGFSFINKKKSVIEVDIVRLFWNLCVAFPGPLHVAFINDSDDSEDELVLQVQGLCLEKTKVVEATCLELYEYELSVQGHGAVFFI
ncbi:hypothetical protein Dimus_017863 [Dionaea muscipula]